MTDEQDGRRTGRPPLGNVGDERAEVDRLRQAVRARELLLEEREWQLAEKTELVRSMLASRSWRLTRPLRALTQSAHKVSVLGNRLSRERPLLEVMFDADWYSRSYGVIGSPERLLRDYLARGWREGRDPMPLLDGEWYAAEYPDRPDGASPLEDFVANPHDRRPNRWFDPAIWRLSPDRPGPDVVTYLGHVADETGVAHEAQGDAHVVARGGQQLADGCAVCVFAHFDVEGVFDPHVIAALAALARCRRIVLCSTAPRIDEDSCRPLLEHVAFVLAVPNTGYDWGAYHAGLAFVLQHCDPGSVTFMNDSVYVIEDVLEPFLERVDRRSADIVGATDSLMFRYHVQSYFVQLRGSALRSPLVDEFLETYVPVSDKHYVINAYELGFSRRALERGLVLDAAYAMDDLLATVHDAAAGAEHAPNATLEFWDVLLEQGFPFVKAQLLRDMSPDPRRLRALVPPETLRLATDHLARTAGSAARRPPGAARRAVVSGDAAADERA